MRLPFSRRTISSHYGWRRDSRSGVKSFHAGTDFRVPSGSSVRPIAAGIIAAKRWSPANGNTVTVQHADGLVSKYFHLREACPLKKGTQVDVRTEIGKVGDTGASALGAHLHLEVWVKGRHTNPVEYIRGCGD